MNNFEKLQITEHLIKRAFIGRAIKSFRPSMKDIMKVRRATPITKTPEQLQAAMTSSYLKRRPYLKVPSQMAAYDALGKDFSKYTSGKGFEGVYSPRYKTIYIPPNTKATSTPRATRRHEMMHALQHQLPFSKTTLGGKIEKLPFVGKRLDDLASEMEAFMYENPYKKWQGFKNFNSMAGDYAKRYAGRPSAPALRAYDLLVNKSPYLAVPGAALGVHYLSRSNQPAQNAAPAPAAPAPPGTIYAPLPPKNNLVSDQ